MTLSIASITFDSADPEPLARWWAERFGAEIVADMDGFFLIVAGGSLVVQLAFQKVDDPTPGKNKVHIDIRTDDDLDDEAARSGRCWCHQFGEAQRGRLPLGHSCRPGWERVLHRQ